MHILIAPDSFKESLTAKEVAQAIKKGLTQSLPQASFDLLPVGDGGEGTVEALVENLGLQRQSVKLAHAYSQDKTAHYATDGQLAIFEMADICGLEKVSLANRNPLYLSTEGVGEMIVSLVEKRISHIMIGVGGSATNDGGIGMAAGLGYRFLDSRGRRLPPIGASLADIAEVEDDGSFDLSQVTISLITDVTNPLCGPSGATYVFGPQKGLASDQLELTDQALRSLYEKQAPNVLSFEGAGAGGGMAAGLVAFADAELNSGIDYVLDVVDFDQRVKKADLVIVGEGRMDRQSLAGKAPVGVAKRTPDNIPVIAICGSLKTDLPDFPIAGIEAAFPIISQVQTLDETLDHAFDNLYRTALNVGQLLKIGQEL